MATGKGRKRICVTVDEAINDRWTELEQSTGKTREALLIEMLGSYGKSASIDLSELSEKTEKEVREAIEQGDNLKDLLEKGLYWAAKHSLDGKKRKAAIDLSGLTDQELEAIPIEQAKNTPGLVEEKIDRTIARLEAWNAANPDQQIDITASYLVDLRDELSRLTGKRISGISRNAVFKRSAQLKARFPRAHNTTVRAKSLGVRAFRDLIEDKIDPTLPSCQMIFEEHLS